MEIEYEIQLIHDQRLIVDYCYVACMTLLIYDHLLTFNREVTFVWSQPQWTYTKVIFLLARYSPIPGIFLILYNQVFLDVSPDTCKAVYAASSWFAVCGAVSAEGILMVRTWAVWQQNRRIALCFAVMVCEIIIFGSITMAGFAEGIVASPAPFKPYRGCFVTGSTKVLYALMCNFAAIDAIVFALMAFSAFRAHKIGNRLKLSKIVHRDGILFYFYVLCAALLTANFVRFAPSTLSNTFYAFPTVVYAVLSTRVIFNIRSVGNDPVIALATELHTVPTEPVEGNLAESRRLWVDSDP